MVEGYNHKLSPKKFYCQNFAIIRYRPALWSRDNLGGEKAKGEIFPRSIPEVYQGRIYGFPGPT
jgi:hypothetical protein